MEGDSDAIGTDHADPFSASENGSGPSAPAARKRRGERPAEEVREAAAGLAIVYRPLRSLIPYARNARTHSPEQIAKLRGSLAHFGWTNPMLIAGGEMIAGHARLQAAIAMAEAGEAVRFHEHDPWVGPTIDLSHLAPADRRAYVLADNRLALDAGWDDALLKIEIEELQIEGFDLALTGFELAEITEMLVPPGEAADAPEPEASAAQNDALDRAWYRVFNEWQSVLDTSAERGWLSPALTKGALGVHFLQALTFGSDIPRTATLAYCPHRVWVSGNKNEEGCIANQLIDNAALTERGRAARDSTRWALSGKPRFEMFIGGTSLPIHGHRAPSDFPALLARDLIDEYAPEAGALILDPCHGWGGRLMGFLLSERGGEYHGFDPAPLTHAGVQAMFIDLSALVPERQRTARLLCQPFEDAKLEPDSYDFALTSPPYFNTERYSGGEQSWSRYPKFDAWVDGFYTKLLAKTAAALKPGRMFALQVGSQQYPLVKTAIEIAPRVGLTHVETRHTDMINSSTKTDPDEGEVLVILRRG